MASAPIFQDDPDCGEATVATDRPAEADASAGFVTLRTPVFGDLVLTADAALETAHRLMDAGLAAKRQVAARA